MQKLTIYIILFLLCSSTLYGQGYRMLLDKEGEVPIIDIIQFPETMSDVARFPESYLNFPGAVQTGNSPQEILAAYIKTDSVRSIEMARSVDGGRQWTAEPFHSNWDGDTFRSLSLFNLGMPHNHRRNNTSNNSHLMLFSGGNPILVSSSYTNGQQWCNFYPANNFGGFRITGVVRLNDGRIMALLHDDGRFLYHDESTAAPLRKSAIYKIYSIDGGLTWSEPQIALKHNIHGLYDAVAVYSPARRDNALIMIVSERETSAAYISFSYDNGDSWSYPEKLPPFIHGDRFGIAVHRHYMAIAFRDMCRTLNDGTPNPTFGDLVMWSGDLGELINGNIRSGIKFRIADNYPTLEPVDYDDRKFFDCGYVSVLPVSRSEVSIIAYGRWEPDEMPFIRNFSLDTDKIRQYAKSIW